METGPLEKTAMFDHVSSSKSKQSLTEQLEFQEEIPSSSAVNIIILLGIPKEYLVICNKGHLN